MKICIYGAGAIGGYMAAELAFADYDVSLVARGPHLAAIKAKGLKLIKDGQERTARIRATDTPSELGPQDYVVITLKAHSVPPVVDAMKPLLGPTTAVVPAVNGVPWWYFYKLPGPWENRRLQSVDPGDKQWNGIGPERAIGCVVYPACEVPEPGVIQHYDGDRFALGEPDGAKTERVQKLSEALIKAKMKAPIRPRIRDDIWVKLWGNMTFNPLSILTLATLDVVTSDPGTRALVRAMMREGQEIGEKLGVKFAVEIEKRIDGANAVGAHKTSMLQDLERGRPIELDALLAAVIELGQLVGIKTPYCDAIFALARQRARVAGCYPAA
ncbi:MAG: 2-dehydropantoate 2-reductase [Alphaproteobacteria bacterium]